MFVLGIRDEGSNPSFLIKICLKYIKKNKKKMLSFNNHINITVFLLISLCLFVVGVLGIFTTRKNIIIILMSIELMLLAINFNFIIFSSFLDDILGQIFALLILTIAAAESAIGLAILVIYYRLRGIISVDYISTIKG